MGISIVILCVLVIYLIVKMLEIKRYVSWIKRIIFINHCLSSHGTDEKCGEDRSWATWGGKLNELLGCLQGNPSCNE